MSSIMPVKLLYRSGPAKRVVISDCAGAICLRKCTESCTSRCAGAPRPWSPPGQCLLDPRPVLDRLLLAVRDLHREVRIAGLAHRGDALDQLLLRGRKGGGADQIGRDEGSIGLLLRRPANASSAARCRYKAARGPAWAIARGES